MVAKFRFRDISTYNGYKRKYFGNDIRKSCRLVTAEDQEDVVYVTAMTLSNFEGHIGYLKPL